MILLMNTHISAPPTNRRKKINSFQLFVMAVIFLASLVFALQATRISALRREINDLEKNQLPSHTYESYEDCQVNGGFSLTTISGQFNACLGGSTEESGDSYQAFLQYSAQNLPRINERRESDIDNLVEGIENGSAELATFLQRNYTGCEIGATEGEGQGYYNIVKEIPNRFALVQDGCANDPAAREGAYRIVAMKLGDGWSLLSPTNNFNEEGVPSCLMVDMFKLSRELFTECFENTGYNNGAYKKVTHP